MQKKITIVIADRNPHVREFLKREMASEGYLVTLAKNGREVIEWIDQNNPIDLLVVDPDLPDMGQPDVLKELRNRKPSLPVVIHTFMTEYLSSKPAQALTTLVEKQGSNIMRLKSAIAETLQQAGVTVANAATGPDMPGH